MQVVAPTGSIAISETPRRLIERYFLLKPLGPTQVKGVGGPVNVYEVTGLEPLRTRLQRAPGVGGSPCLLWREREMESMRNAAELACAGRGQIVAAMAVIEAFDFNQSINCDWLRSISLLSFDSIAILTDWQFTIPT